MQHLIEASCSLVYAMKIECTNYKLKSKYIGSSPKCIENVFYLYGGKIFVLQTYSLICFAYNEVSELIHL